MPAGSRSLAEIAKAVGATLSGDPTVTVSGVADLAQAGPSELSVFSDPARREEAVASRAAALLVRRAEPEIDRPQLICDELGRALARVLELLPRPTPEHLAAGVDPRAVVAPGAEVEPTAWVAPFAYVGPGARIGPGSRVLPFCYVGAGARVASGCRLGPGATVLDGCELGPSVVLGPGAVVGHDGFGYYRDERGRARRIPSVGTVRLGAEVEVGANSCVDRGTLAATEVGEGTKLDNLVQVGHNARIGRGAMLCAQVGLAGSVRVGDEALLGGQVGVADHRRIGDRAQVGAQSGVAQDVPASARVSGYPAMSHRAWLRASALFARLGGLARELRELRAQLARSSRSGSDDG